MLRTLIVLPDGTEIFSGAGTVNAIQSVTITECVNGSQELALGSCCANMVEAQIFTPGGGLNITAGDEFAVYRVADDGTKHRVGLFSTEKPNRSSANVLKLTAYDRVSWLDKDLTQWLIGLKAWPYALYDLADMVCRECGLDLSNSEIPCGDYLVQQFSGDGITGRKIMQWIGQIAGRFCRATAAGEIEFAWYEPLQACEIGVKSSNGAGGGVQYTNGNLQISSAKVTAVYGDPGNLSLSGDFQVVDNGAGNVTLTIAGDTETIMYYQNSLSFEEFTVENIQKVQLRQNEEDIGTVYPDGIEGGANAYIITGNPLLTASSGDDLLPVAQTLFEHLKEVSYTPCKVSIPANMMIRAGHMVKITDRNGREITAYVMTKTQKGQRDVLECTGSCSRDSSTAVNNQSLQALNGKVLNLRQDVEGLKVENKDTAGNISAFNLSLAGIESRVTQQEASAESLSTQITRMEQTAEGLTVAVRHIQEKGAGKVETEAGYSFTDAGLAIHKSGSDIENKVNHEGMYVRRSGETVLQADKNGVIATDVKVHNYLIIGDYARIEDYSDGSDSKRTACFWIGG